MLDEEQANFTVIKKNYPHYFLCSGKDGNIVYVERPPGVDMQQLKSQGVTVDKLVCMVENIDNELGSALCLSDGISLESFRCS